VLWNSRFVADGYFVPAVAAALVGILFFGPLDRFLLADRKRPDPRRRSGTALPLSRHVSVFVSGWSPPMELAHRSTGP